MASKRRRRGGRKMGRWIAGLLIGGALGLVGLNAGGLADKIAPVFQQAVDQEAELARAFGEAAEQKIDVGSGYVLLTPEENGARKVGYLVQEGKSFRLVGEKRSLESQGEAVLSQENGWAVVQTSKDGAPQFTAFQPGEGGLAPADYYAYRAPEPADKTGHHVVIDKGLNALWHYQDGQLVKAYRVATGRQHGPQPTEDDWKTNFTTPEGSYTLTNLVENPPYWAVKDGDQSYAGGHPQNPLGTRWMGFQVLDEGDWGQIWAIHGTSHPEQIGTWASDGCIRMYTHEVEELFAILKGQNVTVQIVAG